MSEQREDRVVVLVARLVAEGFDARPGTGRMRNRVVVRSQHIDKQALARAAKLPRTIQITRGGAGCYVLEFTTPNPDPCPASI